MSIQVNAGLYMRTLIPGLLPDDKKTPKLIYSILSLLCQARFRPTEVLPALPKKLSPKLYQKKVSLYPLGAHWHCQARILNQILDKFYLALQDDHKIVD